MGACLSLQDGPDGPFQPPCGPLFFHPSIKGSQVILDEACCIARRMATFHDGIVFSNRPVELYEKVTVKILKDDPGWQGGLRVGFTWKDPSLRSTELPSFACPDLVRQGKTWAGLLPDVYVEEGTIVSFWVDGHGCVFYSRSPESEGSFLFDGISVGRPLWAVMDVYGRTKAIQLLGKGYVHPTFRTSSETESLCLQFQNEADESPEDCMVCFEAMANTVMLPCSHTGFCAFCSVKIFTTSGCCPLCRQKVKKILRVSILAQRDHLENSESIPRCYEKNVSYSSVVPGRNGQESERVSDAGLERIPTVNEGTVLDKPTGCKRF